MAKLTRVTQKIFGVNGNASHYGQFGSLKAGSPVFTLDPSSIQALSAFTQDGWLDAVIGSNKQPALEDMNGLFRVAFYQLGNIFQDGIPTWDTGTTYYVGSIVRKDGTFELYGSTTNTNLGNALPSKTDNGNWQYLNPPPTQAGVVQDYAGPSIPFGYLNCDGAAYAQASYPDLYTAISSTWNTFLGAPDPGAGMFRVPDLRGIVTLGVGQGRGLPSTYALSSFVGQETHTLVTGEMPSHSHGVNDPGHSHTISNQSNSAAGSGKVVVGGDAPEGADPVTNVTSVGITIQNTGGGGPHNNIQPSAALYKIIKY